MARRQVLSRDELKKKIPPLKESVSIVEKKAIVNALIITGDNLQLTARCLDIARNTLKSKIKEYGIKIDAQTGR